MPKHDDDKEKKEKGKFTIKVDSKTFSGAEKVKAKGDKIEFEHNGLKHCYGGSPYSAIEEAELPE
jgi:hypothetical protein